MEIKKSIIKAKLKITDYFHENSVLIINNNDKCLSKIENMHYKILRISTEGKGDYNAFDIIDKCETLVTIGKDSKYIYEDAKGFIIAEHFETKKEACSYLSSIIRPNDVIFKWVPNF